MSKVFKSGRRGSPRQTSAQWRERLEVLATTSRFQNRPLRLSPLEPMFFGKHKGMSVSHVAKLHPAYMHYLIREGVVLATRELCDLIQQGYDAEASRLSQEYGPIGQGRHWKWMPIQPQRAPRPADEEPNAGEGPSNGPKPLPG